MSKQGNLEKFCYSLYGLTIQSDFGLQELEKKDRASTKNIDIKIEKGICKKNIDNIVVSHNYYTISKEEAYFSIDGCGSYYITGGDSIVIEPDKAANYDELKAYLYIRAFAILLFQRNVVALHGNAVVIGGGVYTLCGKSGAGKTSLSAALCFKGYQLQADDLTVVGVQQGTSYAYPGLTQLRLCKDTVEHFDLDCNSLSKVDQLADKYGVNMVGDELRGDYPFAALIELVVDYKAVEGQPVRLEEVVGEAKLQIVFRNMFMNAMLHAIGLSPECLKQCLQIASSVKVYKLTRPHGRFTLDQQVELIERLAECEVQCEYGA